jgi:hypothetical protein
VSSARLREFGKLRANVRDQAGLSLHAFVIGHLAMRIADSGCERISQVEEQPMQLPFDRCSAYVGY